MGIVRSARQEARLSTDDSLTLGLVDDDDDVRVALERLLRSMGHTVHHFTSVEMFQAYRGSLDCLILDVQLPGLSGLEFNEQIRLGGCRVPVVFITGGGDLKASDGVPATPAGSPLLSKPFTNEELMAAVSSAMAGAAHGPLVTRGTAREQ